MQYLQLHEAGRYVIGGNMTINICNLKKNNK